MQKKIVVALLILLSAAPVRSQQKPADDQPIRIRTDLVQVDVVVTDKRGQVVKGLTKDDFELYESGKKQVINFLEYVESAKGGQPANVANPTEPTKGHPEAGVGRILAFVIDDLTIRYEDLTYVRQMLFNFVDHQMEPTDLVAIVRTAGGKGLLQQFTSDKDMLRRAIAALTLTTHPLNIFNNPPGLQSVTDPKAIDGNTQLNTDQTSQRGFTDRSGLDSDHVGDTADLDAPADDTNKLLRSYMSLGTASFVIDSLKQLPGRKSLILVSGGLPILSASQGAIAGGVAYFLNLLTDQATRAGVAIHTLDIRGLQAQVGVASFVDTPGKSSLGGTEAPSGPRQPLSTAMGRGVDESMLGNLNPFDQTEGHQGLRALSYATGGIPVLDKNDFTAGLDKILAASEGYYLLAYTPTNGHFDGSFRKLEVKVKGNDLKVYNRRGYLAREDAPPSAPTTKRDQLLAAIKAPLARRDITLDAMLLYKANPNKQGEITIEMAIDPKKMSFEAKGDKQQANYDVAGFVFDELGKLRGGFNDTVEASLSEQEFNQRGASVFPYTANTTLPAGIYQVRMAVRDNKTGNIGTISRYLEVPDLSKGKLAASSLLIGEVAPNSPVTAGSKPIAASRRISRKQDLRYAMMIYNPKLKDGKPQVHTQLMISQNGKVIFKEPEEPLAANSSNGSQAVKIGQLGLSSVKPGQYTLTLVVTDTLADKKAQTLTRSMDFTVVN